MFVWSSALAITLIMAIQWSLGEGMVVFVNQKELNDIAPLTQALEQQYAIDANWSKYTDTPGTFRQRLESFLVQMPYYPPHLSRGDIGRERRPPMRIGHHLDDQAVMRATIDRLHTGLPKILSIDPHQETVNNHLSGRCEIPLSAFRLMGLFPDKRSRHLDPRRE